MPQLRKQNASWPRWKHATNDRAVPRWIPGTRRLTGRIYQRARDAFEIVLALEIPTSVPRLGFTVESIWSPFKGTSSNPFTGRTAEDLGVPEIRDNPVELEFEAN